MRVDVDQKGCVRREHLVLCALIMALAQICLAEFSPVMGDDVGASQALSTAAQADLFNALDLTRPELASAAAAWKQNDMPRAQRELALYFRMRASVAWKPDAGNGPPLSSQSRNTADAVVNGKLQGGLIPLVYSFPNGEIDWHLNATDRIPGQAHNNEWQWQLNRMSFWSDLSNAYRATGDERYARAFVQELRTWIAQCPVPDHADNDPGSAWRTIEAGIRSGGSWVDAFYAFRRSGAMSDADVLGFVHAFLDHGRYLRANHSKLNWLTMEMSGLYTVGAEFPELKQASEWRNFAATAMAEESRRQFLPDGGQVELSTTYQNVALDNFLHIAEVARWTGRNAELPPDYVGPLEKAYEWQVDLVAPDRHLPRINDSGPTYLPDVLKKASYYFPSRRDFQWFQSSGRAGAPPPFTSVFLDRSGLAAMRSGWATDANYLLFRVGPLGMNHQHEDSLGVNLWTYGRELVFNGGGGNYEASKWRQWAVSAFSHNTVVVDDLAQTRRTDSNDPFHDPDLISQGPIDAHWQTNAGFDFASGEYTQGYGPSHKSIASQQRDVLFLKPDIYVIADRLRPNDSLPHKFQARWQLLTTHSRIEPSTHILTTEDTGVPNLAVVPLLIDHLEVASVSGQETPEILGWDFHTGGGPELVPATTLLHTLTGTGSHLILTLFLALRPGETNPIKSVEAGKDGVSATATFSDGRKLLISCPGSLGISAREILANGQASRVAMGGKL